MEFTITREQILELSNINAVIKERLNESFPKAFMNLELNKWYTREGCENTLVFITKHKDDDRYAGYGICDGYWTDDFNVCDGIYKCYPATDKEVEEALIAEGGYIKGSKTKCLVSHREVVLSSEPYYSDGRINCKTESLPSGYAVLFMDGEFAEILPEEKTVITKEKVLKILAKKLKVSPENIEIQ